jgi:hypothetical protein
MNYLKDLNDSNVTSLSPIDEILEPLERNRQIVIAPIRVMLE